MVYIQSEFQDRQGYAEKPSLENKQTNKPTGGRKKGGRKKEVRKKDEGPWGGGRGGAFCLHLFKGNM